jgi:hypothetical protein
MFSLTKFFKYTAATFIGVKGYIFFCLVGSTGSHCFEIICVWKLSAIRSTGCARRKVQSWNWKTKIRKHQATARNIA